MSSIGSTSAFTKDMTLKTKQKINSLYLLLVLSGMASMQHITSLLSFGLHNCIFKV
jgi:hypothetical protein